MGIIKKVDGPFLFVAARSYRAFCQVASVGGMRHVPVPE